MTSEHWAIGPSIGIARVGNSQTEFFVEPERAGALPIACDRSGNIRREEGGGYRRVNRFKDSEQRIKRQAARFRLFRLTEDGWRPPEAGEIKDVTWTVHLANKKACWYEFAELRGNLLYPDNAYDKTGAEVKLRNSTIADDDRQTLIIDFGPRTVSSPGERRVFEKGSARDSAYPRQVPTEPKYGDHVRSLGEIVMNDRAELLVLGGFGRAGGDRSISSFAGADTWVDDISDGPVVCRFRVGKEHVELKAWCIVGPPRFAPEILNIVTLADTMEDVAVRHLGYRPDVFADGCFSRGYEADFERDIRPILERPASYRWVANVPAVLSASPPPFDARDNSEETAALRKAYLGLFRRPSCDDSIDKTHLEVLVDGGSMVGRFPMLPVNAGSNSVSDDGPIDKFMSLTQTQYFMLHQWAAGRFRVEDPEPQTEDPVFLTRASLGNCVGAPFCPGIEVTWTTRNPLLYEGPFTIRHRRELAWYEEHGLDPRHDETDPAACPPGCEPGDLTKRMAIPWQADFFQCAAQYINFSDPALNQKDGIPAPPSYYAYWWPPQSPWHVMTGDMTPEEQALAGTPGGYQVVFTRGINTFSQMIEGWSYVGFVLNQTTGALRDLFPNFTEAERNHDRFFAASMSVGVAGDVASGNNSNFNYAWIMRPAPAAAPGDVRFSTALRRGRLPNRRS